MHRQKMHRPIYTYLHVCTRRPCDSLNSPFCASPRLSFKVPGIVIKECQQGRSAIKRISRSTFKTCRKIHQHFLNFRMTFLMMSHFICMRHWSLGQANKISFPFKYIFLIKVCDRIRVGEFYYSTTSLCGHSIEKSNLTEEKISEKTYQC